MVVDGSLIVAADDDPSILRLVEIELKSQGFRVVTATDGGAALEAIERRKPQLAVLDVVMPGMNGLEVMGKLGGKVPVILLTARGKTRDMVQGLDIGAEDYIAKPFVPQELSARVRAVLRRTMPTEGPERVLRSGNVEIDLSARVVRKSGSMVSVTRTEWRLLAFLAENAGKVCVNRDLLTRVWGAAYTNDLPYLHVWVSRLRSKLEDDPANPTLIKTRPGIGYVLEADIPEPDRELVAGLSEA